MDNKKIGERLKKERLKRRETQEDVGKATGVTAMAISQYESGARIPHDSIKIRLARHFNTSVESLFFSYEVN